MATWDFSLETGCQSTPESFLGVVVVVGHPMVDLHMVVLEVGQSHQVRRCNTKESPITQFFPTVEGRVFPQLSVEMVVEISVFALSALSLKA